MRTKSVLNMLRSFSDLFDRGVACDMEVNDGTLVIRSRSWRHGLKAVNNSAAPLKLLVEVSATVKNIRTAATMSQKRRHHEAASGDSVAENPKKQRPNFEPRRKQLNSRGQKRGYNQSNASHDEPKADSTSALKSRIRDLRRLLDHVDKDLKHKMPAGVRIERERELATCEHELAEKQAAEREAEFRNKIIGKYHHIRFFGQSKSVGERTWRNYGYGNANCE